MASLFRRRDEHDQENGVPVNLERLRTTNDAPPDMSLQEPGAKIWMPYLELANKYDADLVHNWRDDMDSLLIFAALFSASVTAFVIESYNNLVQDTGEVTISVLLQISQQIANGTQAAAVRSSFHPASIDIAVNVLWFLSLAFSLTCALAAVLVRQWARQYLRFPRTFSSTSEQARARQFAFENMEWWKMDVIVEMIPALLHISLILFFVGLLLFVRSVSYTLAAYLLCFCTIGGAAYALLTTTPLVFSGCPYKTPFTGFLGLWIKGGTPLFRVLWIGLTTLCAIAVVILCTTLSFFTHRFFPSVNSVVPPWAMKISAPITLHLGRIIARFRCLTHASSQSILVFFHNIGPSLQHFLHHLRSLLALAVSSVKGFTRGFSVTLAERQQTFRDELTIRDAHALQWVMEYSKRDVDLLDIISSVPEFVEMNNSAEVRMVMWRTGVFSRAVRLLHSCTNNRKVANKSVCMACLESIIVLAPCSIEAIEQDSRETDTSFISSLSSTFIYDEPTQLQLDSDIVHLAICAISNIVLRRMYELENSVKFADQDEFNQQAGRLKSAVLDILRPLDGKFWGWGHSYQWDPWQHFHIDHHLIKSNNGWGLTWSQISVMNFCGSLRTFRSAWVTAWMKFHFSSSSSFHRPIWASLLDSATHLQAFPFSTRESQHVVFMLTDKYFRMDPSTGEFPDSNLPALFSIYSKVLYGTGKETLLRRYDTRHSGLHHEFTRRVHVYEGNQLENSGDVIEIPFDRYTEIVGELALFVPKLADGSIDNPCYQDVPTEFQDASARAIRKMIHCRIHEAPWTGEPSILLDTQHLCAVRKLQRYSGVWSDLIIQTAAQFGYFHHLGDDYNIDVHAELQFYDWNPFLYDWGTAYDDGWGHDSWGRGWGRTGDPTFRPDVW